MGLMPGDLMAQTLQGTVTDDISGEPLAGAVIHIVGTQKATSSDSAGEYTLHDIPIGRYTIECLMSGYETQQHVEVQINAHHATVIDFNMSVRPMMLEGVTMVWRCQRPTILTARQTSAPARLAPCTPTCWPTVISIPLHLLRR